MNPKLKESPAGITPPSNPDSRGDFLTDVIVELGFADREKVDKAIAAARRTEQTPEQCLLESGAIDELQLSKARAERNGLDHVDLDAFEVSSEATDLVESTVAARYRALPIAFSADDVLIVAIEDPSEPLGLSEIEGMTGKDVQPVVAAADQLLDLIDRLAGNAPANGAVKPAEPAPEPEPAAEADPATEPAPEPAPEAPSEPAESDELPEALAALKDRMREVGKLAERTERLTHRLKGDDARARQAATDLESERRRAEERERELFSDLKEAHARIASLQRRLSEAAEAARLTKKAADKITALGSDED